LDLFHKEIHICGIFDGQFFIVSFCQVDRYKKILKENKDVKFAGMYYNFEIFHMLEKQIPVDSVEVSICYCNFAESEPEELYLPVNCLTEPEP
jgi:hypothetical protein